MLHRTSLNSINIQNALQMCSAKSKSIEMDLQNVAFQLCRDILNRIHYLMKYHLKTYMIVNQQFQNFYAFSVRI